MYFEGFFHAAGLVGIVIDAETGMYADPVAVTAKDAYTQRMERAYLRTSGDAHLNNALPHFLGGLIGEGDGTDIPRRNTRIDQCGDAMGNDAGLAAAGAGKDQERPFNMKDGFFLRGR